MLRALMDCFNQRPTHVTRSTNTTPREPVRRVSDSNTIINSPTFEGESALCTHTTSREQDPRGNDTHINTGSDAIEGEPARSVSVESERGALLSGSIAQTQDVPDYNPVVPLGGSSVPLRGPLRITEEGISYEDSIMIEEIEIPVFREGEESPILAVPIVAVEDGQETVSHYFLFSRTSFIDFRQSELQQQRLMSGERMTEPNTRGLISDDADYFKVYVNESRQFVFVDEPTFRNVRPSEIESIDALEMVHPNSQDDRFTLRGEMARVREGVMSYENGVLTRFPGVQDRSSLVALPLSSGEYSLANHANGYLQTMPYSSNLSSLIQFSDYNARITEGAQYSFDGRPSYRIFQENDTVILRPIADEIMPDFRSLMSQRRFREDVQANIPSSGSVRMIAYHMPDERLAEDIPELAGVFRGGAVLELSLQTGALFDSENNLVLDGRSIRMASGFRVGDSGERDYIQVAMQGEPESDRATLDVRGIRDDWRIQVLEHREHMFNWESSRAGLDVGSMPRRVPSHLALFESQLGQLISSHRDVVSAGMVESLLRGPHLGFTRDTITVESSLFRDVYSGRNTILMLFSGVWGQDGLPAFTLIHGPR